MTTVRKLVDDVCARLREFPEIARVLIVPAAGHGADAIARKCAEALAGAAGGTAAGSCAVVSAPEASLRRNAAGLVWLDPVAVEVTCIARDGMNEPPDGTGDAPEDAAVRCAAALAGWQPPGCSRPLVAAGPVRILPLEGGGSAAVRLETAFQAPPLRHEGEGAFSQ